MSLSEGQTVETKNFIRSTTKKLSLIYLIMILSGCASKQDGVVKTADDYLAALQTLELDPDKYPSREECYASVFAQMRSYLKQIDDPEKLKTIFYKCNSIWLAKWKHSHGFLSRWIYRERFGEIDPYDESKGLVMYRLAEIGSADAARILVDLYCYPEAHWDGGAGEGATDAVVKCGKPALPFLKEKIDSGIDVFHLTDLTQLIESGATTVF